MVWPIQTIITTAVDQVTDNPETALPEIKKTMDSVNDITSAIATTTDKGPVTFATNAESKTGTVSTKALTPSGIAATKGRGALLHMLNNTAIPNIFTTDILFDGEVYDSDAIHDLIINISRITVPAGVSQVIISGYVIFTYNATGFRQLSIQKNGGFQGVGSMVSDVAPIASIETRLHVFTPVIDVLPGDYFTLAVFQNSGGSLAILGDSDVSDANNSFFSMQIIK